MKSWQKMPVKKAPALPNWFNKLCIYTNTLKPSSSVKFKVQIFVDPPCVGCTARRISAGDRHRNNAIVGPDLTMSTHSFVSIINILTRALSTFLTQCWSYFSACLHLTGVSNLAGPLAYVTLLNDDQVNLKIGYY